MGNEPSGNEDPNTGEATADDPPGDEPDEPAEEPAGEPSGASTPRSRQGPIVPAVAAVLALIVGVVVGLAVGGGSGGDDDEGKAAANSEGHEGHTGMEADGSGLAQLLSDHHYEPAPDEQLDSETRQLLTLQMNAVNELMEENLTIADAEDNGWSRAGPFIPGLGTHYVPTDPEYTITIPTSLDDDEEEGELRPVLIFDGLEDDAPLAGFMPYLVEEDDGEKADSVEFAGPYDQWHRHTNLCIELKPDGTMEAPFVADMDNVTEDMCTDAGGEFYDVTTLMTHVWSVPGYESELGLFSEVNPRLTCPDGTYHRVPYDELESPYLTTCVEE